MTIIVPFTAGGPTDVITRILVEPMSRDLGQPVVIENVTGAGGIVAAARVAQARPDGHTLLMHHIAHASSAMLYRRLPYNVLESFAPLGIVSDAAMTLIARPDFPAAGLAGFMAEICRQGDKLNLAHSGLGDANHLCDMMLQHAAGTAMTGLVFRGSAPAITDLMAGRIDVFCDQATNTARFLRDGRFKGYAVTLPQRVPRAADEHLARPLRAAGHAARGAGAPFIRHRRRTARGTPAPTLRRSGNRPGRGGARHARLPSPVPRRGGRALQTGRSRRRDNTRTEAGAAFMQP